MKVDFPEKIQGLFLPYRYKVARGGRGSAKSWSFARALLIQGMQAPLRVLCAREVQLSIKQSVHKLLKDQVALMELGSFYTIYDAEIRGRNGTEFAFTGLSQLTIDSIKSFEGYDRCWVEEGQTISKRSWDILLPTIRKEGSEIWISYNPDLETDETHQRFTVHPPPETWNVEINWRDNPWFNETMNQERLHCLQTQPDDYDNIWEGKCRPAAEGAIYYKQVQQMEAQNRICDVPYDPMLKVQMVVDLGYGDAMAIGMVQKHLSGIRLIDYIEDHQKTLADYNGMLRERNYNWGKLYLPYADGFSRDVKSGKSSADIMEALGWEVVPKSEIPQATVEEGIRQTRMVFPQLYIDRTRCGRLIECLKRYQRNINQKTGAAGNPVHDEFSHGADMMRYVAMNSNHFTNESTNQVEIRMPGQPTISQPGASSGWMAG